MGLKHTLTVSQERCSAITPLVCRKLERYQIECLYGKDLSAGLINAGVNETHFTIIMFPVQVAMELIIMFPVQVAMELNVDTQTF